MPIRKVLVPIDGSKASLKAMSLAAELAPAQKWTLLLLHVIERPSVPDSNFATDVMSQLMEELRVYGQKVLDDAARIIQAAGAKVSCELIEGSAPQTIIRRAGEECCGMVIIGSTGLGRAKSSSLMFGSVAEQVVRQVDVPVLVVKTLEE